MIEKERKLKDVAANKEQEFIDRMLQLHLEGYAEQRVINELEMISTKFVIEIGEDGDYSYQTEISLHEVIERIKELKKERGEEV